MANIWEQIAENLASKTSGPNSSTKTKGLSEDAIFRGLKAVSIAYSNFKAPRDVGQWREVVVLWRHELRGWDDNDFSNALDYHLRTSSWPPSPGHLRVAHEEMEKSALYDKRFSSKEHIKSKPVETPTEDRVAWHMLNIKREAEVGAKALREGRAERIRRYGPPDKRDPEFCSPGWGMRRAKL